MFFSPKEKGQGLVEYAIILALIAIVVIGFMVLCVGGVIALANYLSKNPPAN